MRTRYEDLPMSRLCCCGLKPAEDAPEEDDLPTSRPKYLVDPSGFLDPTAASDREAQPGPAVPVDSDLVHVVDDSFPPAAAAKTAPATAPAAEAQPPATDEAPTKQPPEKRVSFEIPRRPPASVPQCPQPMNLPPLSTAF